MSQSGGSGGLVVLPRFLNEFNLHPSNVLQDVALYEQHCIGMTCLVREILCHRLGDIVLDPEHKAVFYP